MKKNNKIPPKPSVKVSTPDMLTKCLQTQTPFTLDPAFTSIDIPWDAPILPLIEVLNNNETVTSLNLVRSQWTQQELDELVKCLTENNRSIVKIYGGYQFTGNETNALIKILKLSPRIKSFACLNRSHTSFINMEGFMNFWSNMGQFNIEELLLSQSYCWTPHEYDLFLESFKFNRSIKSFKIGLATNMGEAFVKLCDMLILKQMTEFWCIAHLTANEQPNCDAFKRVLRANHLKKLLIRDKAREDRQFAVSLNLFSEELTNSSIVDLAVIDISLDWDTLATVIKNNKTITRLELRYCESTLRNFLKLDLGANTTMTDLTLARCDFKFDIFTDLCRNRTLKRIELDCSYFDDRNEGADALQKFLTTNTSLNELVLPGTLTQNVIIALADGLKVNQTLQKLTIKFRRTGYREFSYFIEQLKHNNSLTELNALKVRDIYLDQGPLNGKEADDFFLDLLKTNTALRQIEGASEYPYLEERLKANRYIQDRGVIENRYLINMIVARPNLFILPIEIWLRIFTFVSYPLSPISLSAYFDKKLRS